MLSSQEFGRIEVALPEGVDVESEEGIDALNNFSIAIATTDVRDCFHRFRMPHSSRQFFCLRAVAAHVFSLTGEVFEGQESEAHIVIWPCWRVLPMGFSWSLFLAQSCCEEKVCLALSPRRISGDETTQLIRTWAAICVRRR